MDDSAKPKPLTRDCEIGIAQGIILSLITCGLYNLYWNYTQFRAMNQLLGRQEFDFAQWLLLSLVTCGLYHIYYEYKMGTALQQYLSENGYAVNANLGLVGLLLSCVGMTIVADAIYQHELNRLVA